LKYIKNGYIQLGISPLNVQKLKGCSSQSLLSNLPDKMKKSCCNYQEIDNVSIYGRYFEDESFAIAHDKPGIVGMSNLGRPNTNGNNFYITFEPLPNFNKKMVAFGRVVEGLSFLQKLNRLPNG